MIAGGISAGAFSLINNQVSLFNTSTGKDGQALQTVTGESSLSEISSTPKYQTTLEGDSQQKQTSTVPSTSQAEGVKSLEQTLSKQDLENCSFVEWIDLKEVKLSETSLEYLVVYCENGNKNKDKVLEASRWTGWFPKEIFKEKRE